MANTIIFSNKSKLYVRDLLQNNKEKEDIKEEILEKTAVEEPAQTPEYELITASGADQLSLLNKSRVKITRVKLPQVINEQSSELSVSTFNINQNNNRVGDGLDGLTTESDKTDLQRSLGFKKVDEVSFMESRLASFCTKMKESLQNGDPEWGFDKLNPKPTAKSIEEFELYLHTLLWEEQGLNSSFNSYAEYTKQILPQLTSYIEYRTFDDMIESGTLKVEGLTDKECAEEFINHAVSYLSYRNKYSDEYKDYIVKFMTENISGENCNSLYDTLDYLKAGIDDLFWQTSYGDWFNDITKVRVYYESGNIKTDEDGWDITEEIAYSEYGMTSNELLYWLLNNANIADLSTKFQASIFVDKMNELCLGTTEIRAFVDVIWRELAQRTDATLDKFTGELRINRCDLFKINQNGDMSIMDELFALINEKAANIAHMEQETIDNASSINSQELFKNSNYLNAEYIQEHLSEMLLSNDPGVRKFAQMVEDFCMKENIDIKTGTIYKTDEYTVQEKQDRIKWLLVFINKQCGIENPTGNPSRTNVGLTLEALDKLGENVFDKLDDILSTPQLYNCMQVNIDGIIDDFEQGDYIGDCWILAGIQALSSTPYGKELFANAIQWNSDYTDVVVTFPGTGDSVPIPVETLLYTDPDNGYEHYSFGDNDVLAIVIAWAMLYGNPDNKRKHTYEIVRDFILDKLGETEDFFEKFIPNASVKTETFGGLDDIWALITGDKCDLDESDVIKYLTKISKSFPNVAAAFAFFNTWGKDEYSWITIDGESHSDMFSGHELAITNINVKYIAGVISYETSTVTFANPWDSDIQYTVTWAEFAKMGVSQMTWANW